MVPHLGHVELANAGIGIPSGGVVPDRTEFSYWLMCTNATAATNTSYTSRSPPASATHAGVSELLVAVDVLAVEPGGGGLMIRVLSREQKHKDGELVTAKHAKEEFYFVGLRKQDRKHLC